jgi:hypothetical protein
MPLQQRSRLALAFICCGAHRFMKTDRSIAVSCIQTLLIALMVFAVLPSRAEAQTLQCPLTVGSTSTSTANLMCRNSAPPGTLTCGSGIATGYALNTSDTPTVTRAVAGDIISITYTDASGLGTSTLAFPVASGDTSLGANLSVTASATGTRTHTAVAADVDTNASYTFGINLNTNARIGSYTISCQTAQ